MIKIAIGFLIIIETKWNILDLGIFANRSAGCPVYPTISEDDFQYIFNHAEVKYVIVSNKEIYDKVKSIQLNVPMLLDIFSFDKIPGVRNWNEIMELRKKYG